MDATVADLERLLKKTGLEPVYVIHGPDPFLRSEALRLFAPTYNLANFVQRLALPASVKHWSLTTLREKLIKIGAKVVRHAQYVTFQTIERRAVAVTAAIWEIPANVLQDFDAPLSPVLHSHSIARITHYDRRTLM